MLTSLYVISLVNQSEREKAKQKEQQTTPQEKTIHIKRTGHITINLKVPNGHNGNDGPAGVNLPIGVEFNQYAEPDCRKTNFTIIPCTVPKDDPDYGWNAHPSGATGCDFYYTEPDTPNIRRCHPSPDVLAAQRFNGTVTIGLINHTKIDCDIAKGQVVDCISRNAQTYGLAYPDSKTNATQKEEIKK